MVCAYLIGIYPSHSHCGLVVQQDLEFVSQDIGKIGRDVGGVQVTVDYTSSMVVDVRSELHAGTILPKILTICIYSVLRSERPISKSYGYNRTSQNTNGTYISAFLG